jgi:hypothetical protein
MKGTAKEWDERQKYGAAHEEERPCTICGRLAQEHYVLCPSHMKEWHQKRRGDDPASFDYEHKEWYTGHPLVAEQLERRRIDFCPRCEENDKLENDYLCERCRYGG